MREFTSRSDYAQESSRPTRRTLSPAVVLIGPLVLGACALPVPVQVASWVANFVSYAATEKSVSDHGLSMVSGQDCALHRPLAGNDICQESAGDRIVVFAEGTPAEPEIDRAAVAAVEYGEITVESPAIARSTETVEVASATDLAAGHFAGEFGESDPAPAQKFPLIRTAAADVPAAVHEFTSDPVNGDYGGTDLTSDVGLTTVQATAANGIEAGLLAVDFGESDPAPAQDFPLVRTAVADVHAPVPEYPTDPVNGDYGGIERTIAVDITANHDTATNIAAGAIDQATETNDSVNGKPDPAPTTDLAAFNFAYGETEVLGKPTRPEAGKSTKSTTVATVDPVAFDVAFGAPAAIGRKDVPLSRENVKPAGVAVKPAPDNVTANVVHELEAQEGRGPDRSSIADLAALDTAAGAVTVEPLPPSETGKSDPIIVHAEAPEAGAATKSVNALRPTIGWTRGDELAYADDWERMNSPRPATRTTPTASPTPVAAALAKPASRNAPTAPARANAATSGYYYSLASFKQRDHAEKLAKRNRGLAPSIMAANVKGSTYYRVVVGPVAKADKRAVRRKLAAAGFRKVWMFRSASAQAIGASG